MRWYIWAAIGIGAYALLHDKKTSKRVRRNPYFLNIGQKDENWRDPGVKKFQGSYRSVQNLPLKSLADAHSVASMIDADSYAIEYSDSPDGYGSKPVFKTKDILAYEADRDMAGQESEFKALARVEALNKTRRVIVLRKDKSYLIYAMRSPAKYNKGHSSTIQGYSSLWIKVPKRETLDISPNKYSDKHGYGFQKSRFMKDIAYLFGMTKSWDAKKISDFPQIVQALAKEYPAIAGDFKALQKGQWSKSYNPLGKRR